MPVFDQIEQSYLNHARLTQQLHDMMTRLQREVEQIQDLDKTRNEDTAGYVKQHGEKIVQKSVSNLTDTIGTDVIKLVRERMTALSIRAVLHLSAILCIAFAGVFAGGSIVGFYSGARYTTYTMTQGSVSAQVFHDLQIKQPATAEWWAKKSTTMPHFRIDCRQSATHIFISILIIMDDSSAAFHYGWIHKSQTYRMIRKNINRKMTSSTDEAKSYIFGY